METPLVSKDLIVYKKYTDPFQCATNYLNEAIMTILDISDGFELKKKETIDHLTKLTVRKMILAGVDFYSIDAHGKKKPVFSIIQKLIKNALFISLNIYESKHADKNIVIEQVVSSLIRFYSRY